jgi:hypothetical protein
MERSDALFQIATSFPQKILKEIVDVYNTKYTKYTNHTNIFSGIMY